MTGYFSYFPNTVWSNSTCLDITARADVTRRIRGNPRNYYPLNIQDGLRPDRVAQGYYGDPAYAWLVYVSAGVVDPYYGWVLDSVAFDDFIVSKYTSVQLAQQTVHHWQLDWAAFSDTTITPSFFLNSLDENLQKYYEPIFALGATVQAYRLRREDWTETTNQFVPLFLANVSGNGFLLDEPVFVFGAANTLLGNGQICWGANTSNVVIQHITGNVTSANTTLQGVISNTLANINSVGNPVYNIDLGEQAYWGPVSCYDYEVGKNEQNRHVRLVDSRYAGAAKIELQSLLQPNTALIPAMAALKAITS